MKKTILTVLGALAALSLPVSCSEDFGDNINGNGRIIPTTDINTETIVSRSTSPESRANASRAIEVTVADLSLRLTKTDGSFSGEWPLADFPSDKDFSVGEYSLEAFYGDPAQQGFDMPAYSGSQTVIVKDGETATPAVTATLANAMVTIKYTDAFVGYMADYGATVNGIEYTKTEERAVYVTPGDVEIKINVKKPNGLGAEFTLDNVNTEARHHYTVTVDVNNGGVGDAKLNITFDDMMDTEEVEIDLSDKVLSSPAPVITPKGFTDGSTIDVVTGMSTDMNLSMNLVAMAGIRNVVLKTKSTSLLRQGWPEEIDLMNADGATQAKLNDLGLDVLGLWKTPGEMAVLTFSDVVKYIRTVANDDNITEFTVTLKDKLMRESDPVTIRLNVEDVLMDLKPSGEYLEPGSALNVVLGFNGPGTYIKDNIEMEYFNETSGVWNKLKINSVSEGRSRTMLDYTVNISTPAIDAALRLRARYGNSVSNEITVEMAPFELTVSELNVFSKYAFGVLKGTGSHAAPAVSDVTFLLKTENTDFAEVTPSVEGGYVKFSNLAPNTVYTARVKKDDILSRSVTFTTENATDVPNGDMETWYTYKPSGTCWWQVDYPGEDANAVWGTMNLLTTSEGGTSAGASACGYSSKSGTTSDEGNGGGKCALIQTVGWGKGNTAWLGRVNGTSGGLAGGACQHFTAGELYLGHYDATSQKAVYDGLVASSRPSSLQFTYKYTPKNSADWGVAEVHVLAADGSVIAEQVVNLTAQSDFTPKTLQLNYPMGSKKAVRVQVMFKSCGNQDCLAINNNNMDCPPSANASTDKGYIGSKLYVDDIQLIY